MKARDAVILVLKESGKPLHANEITKCILSRGLWGTSGKTPTATVGARICSDIKKNGRCLRRFASFIGNLPSANFSEN